MELTAYPEWVRLLPSTRSLARQSSVRNTLWHIGEMRGYLDVRPAAPARMFELVRSQLRCYGLAMRPHPLFKNRSIPIVHALGGVTLRALSVHDLERDFSAVMESAADIKAANPGSSWPDGLTMEKNLIDLAWHQREFEARRSFAWVIEDAGGSYLGCLYVYPSIAGEHAADVVWWWRSGTTVDKPGFRELLEEWLAGDPWPPLTYRLSSG